jgi:hypothetical protein
MFNNFSENRIVYEIMSKHVVETEGPRRYNMVHTRCVLDKQGCMHVCAHAHAPRYPHARTHARARTYTQINI